jgi:hypothetical protein
MFCVVLRPTTLVSSLAVTVRVMAGLKLGPDGSKKMAPKCDGSKMHTHTYSGCLVDARRGSKAPFDFLDDAVRNNSAPPPSGEIAL